MKAWQYSKELIESAKPVVLDKPPEDWNLFARMEKAEDERVKFWWRSHNLGSGMPECFIVAMIQSLENKGYHAEAAERWIEKGLEAYEAGDMEALFRATYRIKYLTTKVDKNLNAPYWMYEEFTSFDQVANAVEFPETMEVDEQSEDYANRIYAGWLGKMIGSQLGSALEGYTTDQILATCGEVRTYVRKPTTLTNDITHELAFLRCFESKGYAMNAIDIADEWVATIPYGTDAEDLALRSIKLGYYPPESGSRNNPFSDWVGAQMRGMICGMVCPGNAKDAARLAWTDGTVSHGNNGILGEVFNAVLAARAFVEPNVRILLTEAVSMIPATSEYYHMVSTFLKWCRESDDWLTAWRKCEDFLEKYHWVHAYPNAAAEVVGLWFGNGDFDETMHIIAMCGRKADCNASEIGAILGIAKGVDGIGKEWKKPLSDDVRTYVRGMRRLTITGIAERTVEAVKRGLRY